MERQIANVCFELLLAEIRLIGQPGLLEQLGYKVGYSLVEKYFFVTHSNRIAKEKQRLNDSLEMVKFVCKEVWTFLFKKQMDNLKTNHKVQEAKNSPKGRLCAL